MPELYTEVKYAHHMALTNLRPYPEIWKEWEISPAGTKPVETTAEGLRYSGDYGFWGKLPAWWMLLETRPADRPGENQVMAAFSLCGRVRPAGADLVIVCDRLPGAPPAGSGGTAQRPVS
jgi:hypothetical protein